MKLKENANFTGADIYKMLKRYDFLNDYNLGYALESFEGKREAISECAEILEVLKNLTDKDFEISKFLDSDIGGEIVDMYYDHRSSEEIDEFLNNNLVMD